MSHLATADSDAAYTEWQIERFRSGDRRVLAPDAAHREQRRRASLSERALRRGALRDRAVRPLAVRFRPGRGWARARAFLDAHLAQSSCFAPARAPGTADSSSRSATPGSASCRWAMRTVSAATCRHAGTRRRASCVASSGRVSMDAFAVELDRELPVGTPVVLIGRGVLAEEHARVAGTIDYEIATGINSDPTRARRGRRWLSRFARTADASRLGRTRARPSWERRARRSSLPRATNVRSTSAPAPARSRSRSRRSSRRSSASTRCPSCSRRARERAPRRTRRSSKATRPRCRFRTASSISRRRRRRCTTSPARARRRRARARHPAGRADPRRRPTRAGRPARGDRRRPLRARPRPADHERACSDQDLRGLFEANRARACSGSATTTSAARSAAYLDLAGCEGDERGTPRCPSPRTAPTCTLHG